MCWTWCEFRIAIRCSGWKPEFLWVSWVWEDFQRWLWAYLLCVLFYPTLILGHICYAFCFIQHWCLGIFVMRFVLSNIDIRAYLLCVLFYPTLILGHICYAFCFIQHWYLGIFVMHFVLSTLIHVFGHNLFMHFGFSSRDGFIWGLNPEIPKYSHEASTFQGLLLFVVERLFV